MSLLTEEERGNLRDQLCEMRNLLVEVLNSGVGWREYESTSPSSPGGGLWVRCKYCGSQPRAADATLIQHRSDCLIHRIRKAIEVSRGL